MLEINWVYKCSKEESSCSGEIFFNKKRLGKVIILHEENKNNNKLYKIIIYLNEKEKEINLKYLLGTEDIEDIKLNCENTIFYTLDLLDKMDLCI